MKIITVDRVFGAGGHSVGREVAKRLGIEFYDRDIIRNAAKASGVEAEEMEAQEERLSMGASIINAIVPNSYDLKDIVFNNEKQAILGFAQAGPCVILGRCACAILAEAGIEAIDVFLYASPENRIERARELIGVEGLSDAEVLNGMKKRDTRRRAYYEHYTDRRWGDARDYDLFLNSGTLGWEFCVETIVAAVQAPK